MYIIIIIIIDIGWLDINIIILVTIIIKMIMIISESSLLKILVLGINDELFYFFSDILKDYFLFVIYKTTVL